MMTSSYAFSLATAAIVAASITGGSANAGPARGAASPVPAGPGVEQQATAGQTQLLATTYSFSTTQSNVPAGFFGFDNPKTLTCPAGGNCRIEADQSLQVSGGPGGNNRWAICTKVDGVFMDLPQCPYIGVINPAIYQTGAASQQKRLISPGTHTVQTFLYTDLGAQRGIWSIQYRIYQ